MVIRTIAILITEVLTGQVMTTVITMGIGMDTMMANTVTVLLIITGIHIPGLPPEVIPEIIIIHQTELLIPVQEHQTIIHALQTTIIEIQTLQQEAIPAEMLIPHQTGAQTGQMFQAEIPITTNL
jgi:hypothetical protein